MNRRLELERLNSEMRRAYDLVQERRAPEAMKVYQGILAEARGLRLDSAHFHWAYAAACDYSGELEMAFEQISLAVARDPLAPPFRSSFEIIARRLNEALADEERAADDASTPRLHALLQGADQASVAAHLAMARYHVATGAAGAARALLEAVTLLHPTSREAWELLAQVAGALGDAEAEETARIEAAALVDAAPPFAVPGRASA